MRAQAVKEGVSAVKHPAQHILARADFDRDKPAGGQHICGAEVYLSGPRRHFHGSPGPVGVRLQRGGQPRSISQAVSFCCIRTACKSSR